MDGKIFIEAVASVLALFMVVAPAMAADFTGEVIRVLDGDTIEVLHEEKPERIRLYGIDCPEKGQAFGQKAKQATSSLLFGKDVRIESHGRDKHRRTLGTVFDGELNVNQELVKEGWCWWFRKFVPKDQALKQLEQEAKGAKKGLWADPNPVPPGLYRRLRGGGLPLASE
jgi:endonuclease YncB( thermonuclease family)